MFCNCVLVWRRDELGSVKDFVVMVYSDNAIDDSDAVLAVEHFMWSHLGERVCVEGINKISHLCDYVEDWGVECAISVSSALDYNILGVVLDSEEGISEIILSHTCTLVESLYTKVKDKLSVSAVKGAIILSL